MRMHAKYIEEVRLEKAGEQRASSLVVETGGRAKTEEVFDIPVGSRDNNNGNDLTILVIATKQLKKRATSCIRAGLGLSLQNKQNARFLA